MQTVLGLFDARSGRSTSFAPPWVRARAHKNLVIGRHERLDGGDLAGRACGVGEVTFRLYDPIPENPIAFSFVDLNELPMERSGTATMTLDNP